MKKVKRDILFTLILVLLLSISNIYANEESITPATPVLTPDITNQTDKTVTVTISNWDIAVTKEYKIDNGPWQEYTGPVVLTSNATVYARGTTSFETVSDIASLKIKNIKRLLSKTEVSRQASLTVKVVYYDINNIEIGNGSGFIVSSDGQVVTNYHVIDMIPRMEVITTDNKIYAVTGISAYDKKLDLAVLKLEKAKDLPTVILGNSDDLQLGDDIVAIGYPLGLPVTVSFGNVSGLNTPGGSYRTGQKDIQITAPISAGNSGGPLINMYGEVVGINYSYIENAQNINYSIPVNELKPMLASTSSKRLPDIIKEVYPSMNYAQLEKYIYFNYPDKKSGDYIFSFTNIEIRDSGKLPDVVDVYLDLNSSKYAEILLAEFEGNKKEVEKWIDGIYSKVKVIDPHKDVYFHVALYWSFYTRPQGYTNQEAYYNTNTKMWEIYKEKVKYGYKNNIPDITWYQ
jgi:S1-C subfamily serine protease